MPRYGKDTLNELMKDPEFRKEWESMEPEFQIIKAMIDARNEKGITYKLTNNSLSTSIQTTDSGLALTRSYGYFFYQVTDLEANCTRYFRSVLSSQDNNHIFIFSVCDV